MLVLTRKEKKGVKLIVNNVAVTVYFDGYDSKFGARLCIDAPPEVKILREELDYSPSQPISNRGKYER